MRDYTKIRMPHRLTGGQAAALLLLFCIPAILAAVFIWKGVRTCSEYFDRFHDYDALIRNAGKRNGVDPALLKAVIWRESNFNRDTIGSKGEIGLMQIMPQFAAADWARAKHRNPPSRGALADPELNIEIGSWYLGRALHRWREYREQEALALCEYNAGLQRAESWKPPRKDGTVADRITISSTSAYVADILSKRKEYVREFRKNKDASL